MSVERIIMTVKITAPHIESGAALTAEELAVQDLLTRFHKDWEVEIIECTHEIE